MKFKTIYIYSAIAVLVAAVVVFSSLTGSEEKVDPHADLENIPQDDIHKGLSAPGKEQPNKSNVRKEFYERMETLRKSYEDNPADTTVAREYADFLASAHGQETAIKIYEDILKKAPERIDVMIALSMLYYQKQDYYKTEEITQNILRINPDHQEANYNLGAIAASKGEKEKAKQIWEELIKKYPESELAGMAKNSIEKL